MIQTGQQPGAEDGRDKPTEFSESQTKENLIHGGGKPVLGRGIPPPHSKRGPSSWKPSKAIVGIYGGTGRMLGEGGAIGI